jgi:arylsulfatase A-like enzyme
VTALLALLGCGWFAPADPLASLPALPLESSGQAALALDRLPFSYEGASGPPPRADRTLEGRVRAGLALHSPSRASWAELSIPSGARFVAWLGQADGAAQLALEVTAGGTRRPIGQVELAGGEAWQAWEVDLGAYAGQTLELSLVVRGAAGEVFVGAPAVVGRPSALPRRVVVLAVDTLRPDHLGAHGYSRPTSPELDQLAAQSVVFERTWAPAPRTRPSFRTATTGRYPLDAPFSPSLGAVLGEHGFATAGIVANVHLNQRFGFHQGYDLWWLDPQAHADTQVDRALQWLAEQRDRDSFLFLHIMDPHLFYNAPAPWLDQFVEQPDPDLPLQYNRWQVYRWMKKGKLDERRKKAIIGRYDGEIAWTSLQIGRFLQGLDALPGTSLVVFHTDHGEELWDHGGFEHNHTLYDEVVRAALWIRPPVGSFVPHRSLQPATLADLAPTVYELLGLQDLPRLDGVSLAGHIRDAQHRISERELPVGYLRQGLERWGVVTNGHKYVLATGSGHEELYDLTADPREQHNLAASTELSPYREALWRAHRGLVVAPGWRVPLSLTGSEPLVLELPEPCLEAGIIDPQALTEHPVDVEWGEVPPQTAPDVGTVALSEDRRTVTFTPGKKPEGTLYVAMAVPNTPLPSVTRAGQALSLPGGRWQAGPEHLALEAGTVVAPPHTEAQGAPAPVSEHDLLEELGYIGGAEEER